MAIERKATSHEYIFKFVGQRELGSMSVAPCIFTYLGYCESISAGLSYILNGLLVFLILRATSKQLQSYSKVLLINCTADLVFATASVLIKLVGTLLVHNLAMLL